MKIHNTKISDCLLIEPKVFNDSRGSIVNTYLKKNIKNLNFVEEIFTYSSVNVLRGFHGNFTTWKLVQCVFGSVFLVVFDLRKDSKSYLKNDTFHLDDIEKHQLLIPAGCVNAWLTLSEISIFQYKKSEYFKDDEVFLPYDHEKIDVKWPIDQPILSRKDSSKEFDSSLIA